MGSFLHRVFLLAAALAGAAAAPHQYPLYEQCDKRWGNDPMGVNGPGQRSTICGEGCAMSSLAMVLGGLGIQINGTLANPGSFNAWLEENNGYLCLAGDCNNLVLNAVGRLDPAVVFVSEVQKPSIRAMKAGIDSGALAFIAHVRNDTHFVLVVGVDLAAAALQVHDPNHHASVYPYANVTDVIIYRIPSTLAEADAQPVHRAGPSEAGVLPVANRWAVGSVVVDDSESVAAAT